MLERDKFRNPPGEYRSCPLWSWNDELKEPELRRQVREMARVGMGGFFMHARPGLVTPFLEDGWWKAVEVAVDEAARQGMAAWIYDESSYPSGFAGGKVPEAHPELRQKAVGYRRLKPGEPVPAQGHGLGLFYVDEGRGAYGPLGAPEEAPAGSQAVWVGWDVTPPSDWLNGGSYVDLLDPRTTQAFLEITYEPYRQRFGDRFGGVIPGAFTDEPHVRNLGLALPEGNLPWTEALPERFRERFGYDLLAHLPCLFFSLPGAERVRYHYWRLVSELFVESWCRPMYEWCDRHGLTFTGHYWEHAMDPRFSGSMMAPLRYQHMPGVDLLGPDRTKGKQDSVPEQIGNIRMIRVAASVAHQFGRRRVLSETYGGGGWELRFEDQKRLAEWEFVLGVNFLNQHLVHYSLVGSRKHDHPPSFLDHQPWWPDYPVLHTYLSRLSYALSQGEPYADVAVLHPMTSLWVMPPSQWDLWGWTLGPNLALELDHLLKDLSEAGVTWDLVDELHLEEVGAEEGDILRVGQARYRCLIVPPCLNLTAATVERLRRYAAGGGRVLALAPTPTLVDGSPGAPLGEVLGHARTHLCATREELLARVQEEVPTAIRWVGGRRAPVYALVRRHADARLVYLVHVGEEPLPDLSLEIRGAGGVEVWDPATGESSPWPATPTAEGVAVSLGPLEPGESRLLLARQHGDAASVPAAARAAASRTELATVTGPWEVERDRENVLVLDRFRWREEGGVWHEETDVRAVQIPVRAGMGLSPRETVWTGVQPWRRYRDRAPREGPWLELEAEVFLEDLGPALARVGLVVERPMLGEVRVNGRPAPAPEGSFWVDGDFLRVPVGSLLQPGRNVLALRVRYREDVDLEPMYLVGDFAVYTSDLVSFRVAPETGRLHGGPWATQGYPFYAGRMRARSTLAVGSEGLDGRLVLELSDLPVPVLHVDLNGHRVGTVGWRPYRLEVTPWVRPGENRLTLELATSARNLLGPLRMPFARPWIVGPNHFRPGPGKEAGYRLVPEGLPARVTLYREVEES